MKQWYEALFENYANSYESESFTLGTLGECDFIEKEINYNRAVRILDIGCGTGRHSIELSKRGYNVTGIDLSDSMLDKAREKALSTQLPVRFICCDARNLPFNEEFDLAIMICEGAFPLMETDEMNYKILESAAKSLIKGGKFIFTTLNGLFPLFHSIQEFHESTGGQGNATYEKHHFDLMTFRDFNITKCKDDAGNMIELASNERYYVPSEINWLLKTLGFTNIGIYGARLGEFSREHVLRTTDYEMLVVAEKPNNL